MSVTRAVLLLALLGAFAAEAAPAEEPAVERVVVFPLDGALSSADRRLFDAMLTSDLRRHKALELVADDVRQVHVEATRSLAIACQSGAAVDVACATEVGRLAAARWAVIGQGSAAREVRLTLVDIETGTSAAEVTATLPPPGESLTPVLRAVVPDLIAPTAASRPAPAVSARKAHAAPEGEAGTSATLWWIGGGVLVATSALAASAATGTFLLGAAQEAPLKQGEDPDTRFQQRDAWYASGLTLAVIAAGALVGGAALGAVGFFATASEPAAE